MSGNFAPLIRPSNAATTTCRPTGYSRGGTASDVPFGTRPLVMLTRDAAGLALLNENSGRLKLPFSWLAAACQAKPYNALLVHLWLIPLRQLLCEAAGVRYLPLVWEAQGAAPLGRVPFCTVCLERWLLWKKPPSKMSKLGCWGRSLLSCLAPLDGPSAAGEL